MGAGREVVSALWEAFNAVDFEAARNLLHPDFVCEWPQSREPIRGVDNFITINRKYPGSWHIGVIKIVVEGDDVVSEVEVRLTTEDGVVRHDKAVSFFKLHEGKIIYLREYWPEPYVAPDWRKQWVERM